MKPAIALLLALSAFGQPPLTFEVATIKPASPDGPPIGLRNMTLVDVIRFAYGEGMSSNREIRGAPDWATKDRYDIVTQNVPTDTYVQIRQRYRSLLAERFALKFHLEQKEIDVYALVPARADKKLGPKIKDWSGDCNGRPPMNILGGDTQMPKCFATFGPTGLKVTGASMAALTNLLSAPMAAIGRPIVDRTGLTGTYDIDLEFVFPIGPPGAPQPTPDPLGPSIFTAIQEQLGLKLEPSKGKTDVIVIDSAEHPTEN